MNIHAHTPSLAVIDSRSLPVRQVEYCRQDINRLIPETRVTAQQHDGAGRLVAQRDPRFLAPAFRPNMATVYSLSGAVLLNKGLDAGWRLGLPGAAGQIQEHWDGRGSHGLIEYDEQRRPTAIHERTKDSDRRTVERLIYADNTHQWATHNQRGRLICHYDTAGALLSDEYGVLGTLLVQRRRFLESLQRPDWPPTLAASNEQLEPGEGSQTWQRYTACGERVRQVDARGHRQSWQFDRAGQLQQVHLQLKDDLTAQPLLHSLSYNAVGQIEAQSAGNGTVTTSQFDAADGRLQRLKTYRPGRGLLQDLTYQYDAGGNVLELQDHTQPIRYFANQQVQATHRYTYDSLNQLISATGREALGQSIRPELPDLMPSPGDGSQLLNYVEYFDYDVSGNLTLLRHESAHPGQAHRRAFKVAENSNRTLPWDEQQLPDFVRGFDANGNLQALHPHDQNLLWTGQNQLQQIIQVSRDGREDDAEYYVYDHQHQRVRKQQRCLASGMTHVREVRYLPDLEIRTLDDSEHLEVITVAAGRSQVRCLHWVTGAPDGIQQDQLRYCLEDHCGSITLELDDQADIISHEGYYPYGGTAWRAARNVVEARYKTIRYSGKERDVSGLYYYGFRYYAPWLCRWISPDPAGEVDGLNVYRMVGGNPLRYVDVSGLMMAGTVETPEDLAHQAYVEELANFLERYEHQPADSVDTNRSRLGKTYDTATDLLGRSGRHLVNGATAIAMSYMADYFTNTPLDNVISFLVGLTISVAYSKLTSILASKQKFGHEADRIREGIKEFNKRFSAISTSDSQSPQQIIEHFVNNGMAMARHQLENEVDRFDGTASNLRQGIDSARKTAQEIRQTTTGAIDDVSEQLDQVFSAMRKAGFTVEYIAKTLMKVKHADPVTVNHPEPGPSSAATEVEPVSASKVFLKLRQESSV